MIASDIDEVAVEVARANLAANGLETRVECVQAAGFDHPGLRRRAPFGLIFANILKGPLVGLAPQMAGVSGEGTRVILSGILNEQAAEVEAVYRKRRYNLRHKDVIGEWSTLTLEKIQ